MPELPEVETNRRGLIRLVKDKIIESVEVYWPKMFVGYSEDPNITNQVINQQIVDVQRRGKYILFVLDNGYLISHLRMEGQYFYYPPAEIPQNKHKHTHIILVFKDGSQLHYNDVRKFGRIEYISLGQLEEYFTQRKLGPEPFGQDFVLKKFIQGLKKTERMIKPALLSQEYVVGLGNIYVDEVLFRAQVHPQRIASQLTDQEYEKLYYAITEVLTQAVQAGGSTIRTYRNTVGEAGSYQEKLQVYGKQGQPCPHCGSAILKIKVAQRGTHFCPQCQHLEE